MSPARPRLAPLGSRTTVAVVDMQRIFAELPGWRVDALPGIVPRVKRLASHRPERTVFTRFMTPKSAGKAKGAWQHYYLHWSTATRDRLAPGMLDLIEPMAAIAHESEICNKTTYSPFQNGSFGRALRKRDTDTLVVVGVETDVCVLATVLGAVDRGLRVVIATDAVTSGCLPGHDCVLRVMLPRHDRQVELATTRQILASWRD